MEALANDLSGWTTEDLVSEVLKRSAEDRPALRLLQGNILRALLADSDRKVAGGV